MSVGNLKDNGNKGNNFPYQLAVLKLLDQINSSISAIPGVDYETRTTMYQATANGPGYSTGNIIVRYDIIDVATSTVVSTLWFNQNTQTTIATPAPGNLVPYNPPGNVTVTNPFNLEATQLLVLAQLVAINGDLDVALSTRASEVTALAILSSILSTEFDNVRDVGPGTGHSAKNQMVGGIHNSVPPTLTDGDQSELNLDNKGNLKTVIENVISSIIVGGVNVNNFPALQLVSGILPSVTANDQDSLPTGNVKDEDFLKIGGYDESGNVYRIVRFEGSNLKVTDSAVRTNTANIDTNTASINTRTGAVSDTPYTGSGNSTIISALKGLYNRLISTLTVNQVTFENQFYLSSQAVIPTTLTTGLNYFWLRNTDATKKIYIQDIEIICFFAGTAAATRSNYVLRKFTGATSTTGTTVNVLLAQTGNPVTIADCKWSPTGGTLTAATLGNNFMSIGHPNQLTANIVHERDFTKSPIVLNQNEGIVLQSDGAIVLGSTVMFNISWIEK